jgi:hypothetical protein
MDSYVTVLDAKLAPRASDNDSGGGHDAHLEYAVVDNPGDWYIVASHLGTLGLGPDSLSLQCSPTGPGACVPGIDTLCIDDRLGDRRFEVKVDFSTTSAGGVSGPGRAASLANKGGLRGGLSWFFSSDNPELVIKVLNGCAVNGHFWVFYSASTDAGLTLTVTDTATGRTFVRSNPDHHPVDTVQATEALPCS